MKKIVISSLLALLVLSGAICKSVSPEIKEATKPVQLVFWRVYDDSDAFSALIAEYNKMHPNINITYRKLRFSEFEKKLLDALAEDRGPDIFSILNICVICGYNYPHRLYSLAKTCKKYYLSINFTQKINIPKRKQDEKILLPVVSLYFYRNGKKFPG